MLKRYIYTVMFFLLVGAGLLPSEHIQAATPNSKKAEVLTLDWPDLIPAGHDPNQLVQEYRKKYKIDGLPGDNPRVKELIKKLDELARQSPVNTSLNGKTVKLPGYVIPLETDGEKTSEFLLVPYFGACIHVPPPPANQTVYVTMENKKTAKIRQLYDVVWVTGEIKTEKLSNDLAETGYTIRASLVEPYQ